MPACGLCRIGIGIQDLEERLDRVDLAAATACIVDIHPATMAIIEGAERRRSDADSLEAMLECRLGLLQWRHARTSRGELYSIGNQRGTSARRGLHARGQ